MNHYTVTLTLDFDAESAEEATDMFRDYVTGSYEPEVTDEDTPRPSEVLGRIARLLDVPEWDVGALDEIAVLLSDAGYHLRSTEEFEELEP